jgi:hypothetical protein
VLGKEWALDDPEIYERTGVRQRKSAREVRDVVGEIVADDASLVGGINELVLRSACCREPEAV